MTTQKYNVIYADPPWETTAGPTRGGYLVVDGKQVHNVIDNTSRPLPYVTMSVDEIALMPVKELAADDAHLYLWVTNGYLPFAFQIIEAWGFKYSTCLVWAKNGYPKHSKKPFFFHHLIERVSPGPYLKLFARDRTAGWDVYGNEVNNSILI